MACTTTSEAVFELRKRIDIIYSELYVKCGGLDSIESALFYLCTTLRDMDDMLEPDKNYPACSTCKIEVVSNIIRSGATATFWSTVEMEVICSVEQSNLQTLHQAATVLCSSDKSTDTWIREGAEELMKRVNHDGVFDTMLFLHRM